MHRSGKLVLESFCSFIEMNAPLVHQPGALLRRRLQQKQLKEQIDPKLEFLTKDLKSRRKSNNDKPRERPLKSREKRTAAEGCKSTGQLSKAL